MRAPHLALVSALVLAAGSLPASAQLSGGVGASNAANQSFQQQNQMRGMQQQQQFNANQNRLQNSTNSVNAGMRTGPYVVPRGHGGGRPERER